MINEFMVDKTMLTLTATKYNSRALILQNKIYHMFSVTRLEIGIWLFQYIQYNI